MQSGCNSVKKCNNNILTFCLGFSSESLPEIVFSTKGKSSNPLRKIFYPIFFQRDKNGAITISQKKVEDSIQEQKLTSIFISVDLFY